MILEIKDFHSPDIASFKEWIPGKLEDIYFLLELEIGFEKEEGSELFQVIIASPEALRLRENNLWKCFSGRDYFIVLYYNWAVIETSLKQIVKKCSCQTWRESVFKLTRYFSWEYEDHECDN